MDGDIENIPTALSPLGGRWCPPKKKKKTKKNSSFTTINLDAFLKLPWDEFESYEVKSRTLPVAVSAVI